MKRLMLICTVLIVSSFLFPFANITNAAISESNLDIYAKYFYNRYSSHFDNNGLTYSSPTYGVTDFKKPETAREWLSLSSYYKYRAIAGEFQAKQILRQAIFQATIELKDRPAYTQSFNDAEAFFIAISLIESVPNLLNDLEKNDFLDFITEYLEAGIMAKDTENRAIVAGAHWQYIVDYLYQKQKITPDKKQYFDKLIKNKIDQGVKQSIFVKEGWYFEDKKTTFSVHYHAISAFMLLVYGDLTGQDDYIELAKKMYLNIKKISFTNGMVEARLGNRPLGLGAQFYLAMGLMGKSFNDEDYQVYLFYGSGNRFFSDKNHPNRLEFHSTIEFSKPNYHDDYAFSDIVELGLIMDKVKKLDLTSKYRFDLPQLKSKDKFFNILNKGNIVYINGHKAILGSWGNWSQLHKNY